MAPGHERTAVVRLAVGAAFALAVFAIWGPSAFGGRKKVQVGNSPAVYVDDSETALAHLSVSDPLSAPGPALDLGPAPASVSPPPPPDPFPDRSADKVMSPVAAAVPVPEFFLDSELNPTRPPPSAAFLSRLASIYGITEPAQIDAIWSWYLIEDTVIPVEQMASNAVVRYALACRQPVAEVRFDQLSPTATQGTVSSSNGISIRSVPWGAEIGSLPAGATFTIDPPADGVWYKVQGSGWVCGLWCDLR